MSEMYLDRPTYMDSDESSDSSYQCSSQSLSSFSSHSSTKDFFNMETREDSFLENMYHFVRECLSNQELMTRLKPKQNGLKLKNKQVSVEQNQQKSLISSKYIKKPAYESKVQKMFDPLEILQTNKFQIAFIIISIVMIVLRGQDLNNLYKEKSLKACLDTNTYIVKEMQDCMKRVNSGETSKTFIQTILIFFFDYNQLFYLAIISIALYTLIKNISSTYSIKSFSDYLQKYQRIHNLNSESKVKLSELKDVYLLKQSQINQNNPQSYINEHPKNRSFSLFGISFNMNMFFFQKQKNRKAI